MTPPSSALGSMRGTRILRIIGYAALSAAALVLILIVLLAIRLAS